MKPTRPPVVVLGFGAVVVVGLVWLLGGQDEHQNRASRIPLVCGVPTALFRERPRPLGTDEASHEVRRDPSRIGAAPKRWRIYERGDTRTYVAGEPPSVHVVSLTLKGSTWRWSGGGGCDTFVEPPGRAAAIWAIPREGIDHSALQFNVLAHDRQCASGRSSEERVGQAHVRETDTSVTVTFTATALEGNQTCPSHAHAVRVVKLRRPLGGRTLLDGGVYPPQPACVVGGLPPEPRYCDSHFY
jgi:hypothetical protein